MNQKRLDKQLYIQRIREAWNPTPPVAVGKLQSEALSIYGNLCVDCSCAFGLELDHVENNGREHRLAISKGRAGEPFYQALKKLGWPNREPFKMETVCKSCHKMRTKSRGKRKHEKRQK